MKFSKKLILCALAGAFINNAYAIDDIKVGAANVSLYGRASAGIDYTKNNFGSGLQGDRWQTASNQWGVSYWGIQAQLPVDQDVSAFVNLESGFGTDTGAVIDNGNMFNRKANVGLNHQKWGSISLGTHLWIAQDVIDLDPMHFQSIGINSLVNGANDGSVERAILVRSPSLHGFQVAYMHSFGGMTGNFKRGTGDGVSFAYQNSGLTLRAIYGQRADEFGRYSGGDAYGLGSRDQWKYVKNLVGGAAYRFGSTTVYAGAESVKAPEAGYGVRAQFDEKARMLWLGANHQLTSKTTLLGAVYQLKQSYSGKKSALGSIGLNYEWNQYLTAYATLGYIGNNTISADKVSNAGENSHALSYFDTACNSSLTCNGANQMGGYAGLVIKF